MGIITIINDEHLKLLEQISSEITFPLTEKTKNYINSTTEAMQAKSGTAVGLAADLLKC